MPIIAPGVAIRGQIIWEGKASLEKDELSVMPGLVDSPASFLSGTRPTPGNFFTLKDLSDGTYRVRVTGESKDCYIKEIRYGPSDSLDDGFTVASGAPPTWKLRSAHAVREYREQRRIPMVYLLRVCGGPGAECAASIASPIVQIAIDRSVRAL